MPGSVNFAWSRVRWESTESLRQELLYKKLQGMYENRIKTKLSDIIVKQSAFRRRQKHVYSSNL